jgi:hypothetical protein
MTFLKRLRDAAMECTNIDYRQYLRFKADTLELSLSAAYGNPTTENMKNLNGAWASAWRAYNERPEEGTPSPMSGSPEPARLAA